MRTMIYAYINGLSHCELIQEDGEKYWLEKQLNPHPPQHPHVTLTKVAIREEDEYGYQSVFKYPFHPDDLKELINE